MRARRYSAVRRLRHSQAHVVARQWLLASTGPIFEVALRIEFGEVLPTTEGSEAAVASGKSIVVGAGRLWVLKVTLVVVTVETMVATAINYMVLMVVMSFHNVHLNTLNHKYILANKYQHKFRFHYKLIVMNNL